MANAGGIVGYMNSDGPEKVGEEYYPYFYNCLNIGSIYAYGNDARSGGMCGLVHDDDTRFINCVNIGNIDGGPETGIFDFSPYLGGISGGSAIWGQDGGTAYYCDWDATTSGEE